MCTMRKCFFGLVLGLMLFWQGCSSTKPEHVLSMSEQIEADTKEASSLFSDFEKKVHFVSFPQGTPFLEAVAQKIAKVRAGFVYRRVTILIHRDDQKNQKQFFSFPGTTISMPLSFLKSVQFENELAAAFAYELANVMNRHVAKKMEGEDAPATFELFGPDSVFNLDRNARTASIDLGAKLMYHAGYDTRGMASIFRQYSSYFAIEIPESKNIDGMVLYKKEVEFNLREAQRAKSLYLPATNPVVRSAEFITLRKAVKHL